MRKRKSLPSLNSYMYTWPLKQFLYFTYARKKCATVEKIAKVTFAPKTVALEPIFLV